ncbi:MAG: glycosyltransferase family 39 protein [Candidatus Omnitrophota bacterium]
MFLNKTPDANRVFRRVLLAIGIYGVISFSWGAALKIGYIYGTNLGEAPVSQAITWISQGKNPYHDLRVPPYLLVPYGPVYLLAAAGPRMLLSGPFVAGRLVTFLASLGTAWLIYRILRLQRTGRTLSAAAAALFLSGPYAVRWGVQVNVDMSGIFLSAAALLFFLRSKRIDRFFWFGAAAAIAAFFTKTSMAAVGAAYFFYLVTQKRFREAILLFAAIGTAAALIYGFLMLWTGGQYYFHTTYEIGKRHFYPAFIWNNWAHAVRDLPVYVWATFFIFWRALRSRKVDLLTVYLLLSVFLTVSMGKQGSDTNYLLEWCLLSSVAMGLLADTLSGVSLPTAGSVPFLARLGWIRVLALWLLVIQACLWVGPPQNLLSKPEYYRKEKEFYDKFSKMINGLPGKILSEDMGLLVANGREIYYEPFPMGQMSYSGIWDQDLIIRELERREFSMAILYSLAPRLIRNRMFTEKFMDMFNRRYILIGGVMMPHQVDKDHPTAVFAYRPRNDSEIS